jgi:hypothetical protein
MFSDRTFKQMFEPTCSSHSLRRPEGAPVMVRELAHAFWKVGLTSGSMANPPVLA